MLGAKLDSGLGYCNPAQRQRSVAVQASFSFAESERAKTSQQGRRNRAIEKRQENELRNIVHGMCKMSSKQLQAVSHLLSREQVEAIKIAMDIPPTNQGRRRQEGLVVKLLRADLDTLDLTKLSEAVVVAERNNLQFTDKDVEQQLQCWIEGLVDNEQKVVDEVYQLLQQQNLDWQQLRTWVRQLQQDRQAQQEQQRSPEHLHDAAASSSSSDSTDEAEEATWQVEDLEVQQLMLELAQDQQLKQRPSGRSKSSSKKQNVAVTSAKRSIRGMLRPLAIECCN